VGDEEMEILFSCLNVDDSGWTDTRQLAGWIRVLMAFNIIDGQQMIQMKWVGLVPCASVVSSRQLSSSWMRLIEAHPDGRVRVSELKQMLMTKIFQGMRQQMART